MTHPFRIDVSVEIEATPEEVWEALTVGQQLDGWWIGAPNDVEPRLGGTVRQTFGDQVSESTITAWDPPHRFADAGTPGPDGVVHALEFTVEGRSGTTTVRLVHSGFLGDDWEAEYEALSEGDPMYLNQLAEYVRFFRGRPVAVIEHFQPGIADRGAAMSILRGGLGLGDAVALGDTVRVEPAGLAAVEGTVDYVAPSMIGLRTTTPCTGSRSSRWVAASTWATTSTGTTSTSRPSPRPGRRGWTAPSRPARPPQPAEIRGARPIRSAGRRRDGLAPQPHRNPIVPVPMPTWHAASTYPRSNMGRRHPRAARSPDPRSAPALPQPPEGVPDDPSLRLRDPPDVRGPRRARWTGHLRGLRLSPDRDGRGVLPLQPARWARCARLPRRPAPTPRTTRRAARSPSPSDRPADPAPSPPRSAARDPTAQAGRSVLDDDPIADAADRHDLRPAGGLDLGAQARQVRLEPEQVRVGLGRPAGARQLEVRDDVAAGADERLEQPELGRRQGQRRLADPRLVTARLQHELAGRQRPAAGRARAAASGPPGA